MSHETRSESISCVFPRGTARGPKNWAVVWERAAHGDFGGGVAFFIDRDLPTKREVFLLSFLKSPTKSKKL